MKSMVSCINKYLSIFMKDMNYKKKTSFLYFTDKWLILNFFEFLMIIKNSYVTHDITSKIH